MVMRRFVPAPLKRPIRKAVRGLRNGLSRPSRPGVSRSYQYVFVVTYGRSGSTLLMSLLNTIPGYRIHGENYNALYHVYQAASAVRNGRERWGGRTHLKPQSGWYGMPEARPDVFERELVDSFVAQVLRPRPGDRVLGFKEIRYTPRHMPDLDEYLGFLRNAFPHSKIIFNHRDPVAVARSGWWTRIRKALELVKAADDRLWSIPADQRHFHFNYDKIDDSLGHIRELFGFLGEPLDERKVRAVLDTRHSPPPRGTVPVQKEPTEGPAQAGRPVDAD
jgi:hypothetical protein